MSMKETSRRHILTAGAAAIGATAVAAPVAMAGAPPMSDALAQAIERHKAAWAAVLGHKGPEDLPDALVDTEQAALLALAEAPVANDGELIAKLKYLLAHEKAVRQGRPFEVVNDEGIQLALDLHLNGEALS